MTKIASAHFERGEFDKAARRYREILQAFPQDSVATSLLAMCQAEAPA